MTKCKINIIYACFILGIGIKMLNNHRHMRILRVGQPYVPFNIKGSLPAGALLQLEGVFLL